MTDDLRLAALGKFTPEGVLTPGYGDHYLFLVGRDDCHNIMHLLLTKETMGHSFNAFGYDDEELNADIVAQMGNPNIRVQGTLDYRSSRGVHERDILALDVARNPDFFNSVTPGTSATGDISHTKGGVLVAQGVGYEGSMNWSTSGEGVGVSLDSTVRPKPGYKAQNNTLLVSVNPVFVARFSARLNAEHSVALQQQAARTAAERGIALAQQKPPASL
jgi:hypothetical protein